MAQGDGYVFGTFKERVMEGVYNLASGQDTVQIILVGPYTLDLVGDTVYGDVSGTEYNTGAGYTSGGETLAGQDTTQTDQTGTFDGTDQTWASLGPLTPSHPSYAIMYDGTPAGDPLMFAWEVSGTAPNGGNWTLQFGANGILILV
jgi:hypothetical protein